MIYYFALCNPHLTRFHHFSLLMPNQWFCFCWIVSFSKPLMDLLVTLCAQYRLNPAGHTLELVTANSKNTKLKPNALIGTVEAEKILLKPKGEDKNKKTGPQMPEVHYTHETMLTHEFNTNICCFVSKQICTKRQILYSPGNCSDGDKLQKDSENYTTSQPSSSTVWTLTSHLWEMWIWHWDDSSFERCPITGPFGLVLLS